jgi:hypothetical protein
MSSKGRNFLIAYVLLVGLPLLGLALMLQEGRHLHPPPAVDGAWTVEADHNALAALPCLGPNLADDDLSVVISQSGTELTVSPKGQSKTSANAVLEGTTISGSLDPGVQLPKEMACSDKRRLAFRATLGSANNHRTLNGKLWIDGCAGCAPVEFQATRVAETSTKQR